MEDSWAALWTRVPRVKEAPHTAEATTAIIGAIREPKPSSVVFTTLKRRPTLLAVWSKGTGGLH